jgi:hypothetical protein
LGKFGGEGLDVRILGEILKDIFGRLDSLDRNDLSLDDSVGGINNDFFGVDEVSYDGEFL